LVSRDVTEGTTGSGGTSEGGGTATGGSEASDVAWPAGAANDGGAEANTSGDGGAATNTGGHGGAEANTAGDGGAEANTAGDGGAEANTAGDGGPEATQGDGGTGAATPAQTGGTVGAGGPATYDVLENPGFETGLRQDIPGWEESGRTTASYIRRDAPHSGVGRLGHSSWSDFEVTTYQLLSPIENGTYTLGVWVDRVSGTYNSQYLFVRGHSARDPDDEMTEVIDLATSSDYQQVVIDNIQVTSGQCEIGVYTHAKAFSQTNFDDFTFTQDG
jgi:hypothetical protein